jgi:3-deoxy-manno-octulosonate cytidylyltransferase (CMP-KDO synthetase)
VHPATGQPAHASPAAIPRAIVVIPARYHSTRLPGKALVDIGGRPMIEHVYRRAAAARGIAAVVVATDDERIAAAVRGFGGEARLTRPDHRSGTDRVAEVARDLACDIVVNVQGDEPTVHPESIEQVVAALLSGRVVMATLRTALHDPHEIASPHVVKVVVDQAGDALYFSRAPIPCVREDRRASAAYKHIGLYAYRREFLLTLASLAQTPLEQAESLEQLRALEHGYRIRVVETGYDSVGVDTPDDLARARGQLGELPADAPA